MNAVGEAIVRSRKDGKNGVPVPKNLGKLLNKLAKILDTENIKNPLADTARRGAKLLPNLLAEAGDK